MPLGHAEVVSLVVWETQGIFSELKRYNDLSSLKNNKNSMQALATDLSCLLHQEICLQLDRCT